MGDRVRGKVALITGAARGQGRAHAVRMAQEGADILAIDALASIEGMPYPPATEADLAETAELVRVEGRRIVAAVADVRDEEALRAAVDAGVTELGRLDVVCANAGILNDFAPLDRLEGHAWANMLDVNLTGVWHTCKVTIPHLRAVGGGSIVITSSVAGLKGAGNIGHYSTAKHGLVGLMRSLAIEGAPHSIRVNTVHPTQVPTPMIMNDAMVELFGVGDEDDPHEAFARVSAGMNTLPVSWVEPMDVANAVLWLASDEARYVTGVTLPIDAGAMLR